MNSNLTSLLILFSKSGIYIPSCDTIVFSDIILNILRFDHRFAFRAGQLFPINPIPRCDPRFEVVSSIPQKEICYSAGAGMTGFVYLPICDEKDYFIHQNNYNGVEQITINVFLYSESGTIRLMSNAQYECV